MFQTRERFLKPEIFLAELLRKSAQGRLVERDENIPFLHRALVVAVDVNGGKLENPDGDGTVTHVIDGKSFDVKAIVGVENPRNSIKARLFDDGFDQFMGDERLKIFWPFYPEHIAVPIKPGEHVYVFFEDEDREHGLWFSKVPGHENMNFYRGQKSFKKENDGTLQSKFSDSKDASGDTDELNTDIAAGETTIDDGRLRKLYGV